MERSYKTNHRKIGEFKMTNKKRIEYIKEKIREDLDNLIDEHSDTQLEPDLNVWEIIKEIVNE